MSAFGERGVATLKRRAIRMPWQDRVFVSVNTALLLGVLAITVYPVLFVLSASISDPKAVGAGKLLLLPILPSARGYQYILQYRELWIGYANTIFYTVAGTALNLVVTLPCAYALSRRDMRDRNAIMVLFLVTMYFSGGLVPAYLNMRDFHLLDTRAALLLVGLLSTYNMIVARTFFANTIPWELHEAAFLDGCSDFVLFLRIILPLSAPIVVVMTLYYGVGHWNSYFNALIYLRGRDKYPLQLFLREILLLGQFQTEAMAEGGYSVEEMREMIKQQDTANMIKYGVIVVSTVPMMILYPFLQRFFVKGVMIGAVKG
jgi:putative aldouronate transport system permease protein